MMVLSDKEERLVQTIRALPEETAEQVLEWAAHLRDLTAGKPVQWADAWTDEDMREATAASLRRFEELEPESY